MKFMCENKDLHEYEKLSSVNNATTSLFMVLKEFVRKLHFVKIIPGDWKVMPDFDFKSLGVKHAKLQ